MGSGNAGEDMLTLAREQIPWWTSRDKAKPVKAEWHWRRGGQEDSSAPLAAALSSAWLNSSFLGSHCCPTCKFSVLQCKEEGRRALERGVSWQDHPGTFPGEE